MKKLLILLAVFGLAIELSHAQTDIDRISLVLKTGKTNVTGNDSNSYVKFNEGLAKAYLSKNFGLVVSYNETQWRPLKDSVSGDRTTMSAGITTFCSSYARDIDVSNELSLVAYQRQSNLKNYFEDGSTRYNRSETVYGLELLETFQVGYSSAFAASSSRYSSALNAVWISGLRLDADLTPRRYSSSIKSTYHGEIIDSYLTPENNLDIRYDLRGEVRLVTFFLNHDFGLSIVPGISATNIPYFTASETTHRLSIGISLDEFAKVKNVLKLTCFKESSGSFSGSGVEASIDIIGLVKLFGKR